MSFQHEYPYGDVHETNLDWLIQTMQDFINSERAAGNTPTVASVRSYFTHKYPYGDIHELNLDWVIQTALRMEEIGDSVEGDIGELQTRMTTAEGNISTLNNTVGGLSDSINQIETEIENINDDVEELQTAVTHHTTQIEDLDDKIDTQVVANPAGTATDTLDTIEIAGTVYEIQGSGGSEVEPNPAGEPTDTLEKIGIDGTVYDVGGSEPVSKTVTGKPIHIVDAADAPIVSGEVTFEPIQDLHGYDKPWAGGAGKNKFETTGTTTTINGKTFTIKSDGSVSITGVADSNRAYVQLGRVVLNAGTYILSSGSTSNNYFVDFTFSVSGNKTVITSEISITISQTEIVTVWLNAESSATPNNVMIYPMIRTSGDSRWEPYSNICPIEGYTECEVEVTGKNLLQNTAVSQTVNGVTFTVNSDGSITCSGTATGFAQLVISNNVPVSPNMGNITLSGLANTINIVWDTIIGYDSKNNALFNDMSGGRNDKTYDLSQYTSITKLFVSVKRYTNNEVAGIIYPQLELGTEATAYKPYQSTTYTIDLDGTRYGGTVDLVSEVLTVTQGYIATYAGETIGEPWISDRDEYVAGTTPTTGAEVVYTLATPTTVQLTPWQIRTLEGTNNISTNMTDMTIEYITDSYQPLVKLIERSAGHHYSTQERVIGTWIDGKPLYEKMVHISSLPSTAGRVQYPHSIEDIDTIASSEAYAIWPDGTIMPLNTLQFDNVTENVYASFFYQTNKTVISISSGMDRSNLSANVTIRYTKTTD